MSAVVDEACPLTQRHLDVLRLVSHGKRTYEIARELYLAHSTVKHHMWAINRRLGTTSGAQAVATALRRGWIE